MLHVVDREIVDTFPSQTANDSPALAAATFPAPAMGHPQEAAANHTALCSNFMLGQNTPTTGCDELIKHILPWKLMELEPQSPKAKRSSFNSQETELQHC